MANLDIYNKEWLEVIFADKNKLYGAYQLRKNSSLNAVHALLIGAVAFILVFLAPKIYSLINGSVDVQNDPIITRVVDLSPPKVLDPKTPPPPPVEPPKPKVAQVKMPPPIVIKDNLVISDPPTVDKLKFANPGPRNIDADPSGSIVINEQVGNGPKSTDAIANGEAGNKIYDFRSLEKQPEFPGGMDKFYKYLNSAIQYPGMASENGVQGKVFLQFVVEKNGTLTDIEVLKGPGSGLNEEAIRVLMASPRWIPGNQNGAFVRVRFNIAVNFNLN